MTSDISNKKMKFTDNAVEECIQESNEGRLKILALKNSKSLSSNH
jgi:hypothetical protein